MASKIPSSEITPKHLYLSRRQFIRAAGAASLGLAGCAADMPEPLSTETQESAPGGLADERGDPANSYEEITNYNNYYEFTYIKEAVAELAQEFPTSPWDVEVSGLVENPGTFSVDELVKKYPPEERIYRLRCVEGWSMVIPWLGFPLAKLLQDTAPTVDARFVRFESILKPDGMPGQNDSRYPWPYQEGLRLDEAMHNLTLLATGLYGGELPPQNGGGIRLVVPWKYGFKSIKAVVKIELTAEQPQTFWNQIAPREYGFYGNVNPEVPHPRWSQSTERRIGETARRQTLFFNGYAAELGSMYDALDLEVNY